MVGSGGDPWKDRIWQEYARSLVFPICGSNGRPDFGGWTWHCKYWFDWSTYQVDNHPSWVTWVFLYIFIYNPAEDPTILSGTLRSTLDVFDEYDDAEIVSCLSLPTLFPPWPHTQFEALRRVHLIPSGDTTEEDLETINVNVFRNLDSPVSEGGENFSTG